MGQATWPKSSRKGIGVYTPTPVQSPCRLLHWSPTLLRIRRPWRARRTASPALKLRRGTRSGASTSTGASAPASAALPCAWAPPRRRFSRSSSSGVAPAAPPPRPPAPPLRPAPRCRAVGSSPASASPSPQAPA